MTQRIKNRFHRLSERGEKALVGFVSAGDPSIPRSLEIIKRMCDAGLDILELGVPFSDPTADGPVIQRSSQRALAAGCRLSVVLEMTAVIRKSADIPIILFSYYNPILAYGGARFYTDALAAGADGVLLVDLPPEESAELTDAWPGNDLALVRLLAPTTPPDRMRAIAASASGFLYLISKTGVTGSDGLDTADIGRHAAAVKSISDLPVCVGFGISTEQDVAAVAKVADGVVIGSAFERIIEENLDHDDLPGIVGSAVKKYKKATVI